MGWFAAVRGRLTRRRFEILAWRAQNATLRLWRKCVPALAAVQSLGIPALAAALALLVDYVLPPTVAPKTIGDLLVGTATLVGGFLTVAFALSVSLQQSVADLYSPQHLSEYSYGRRQKLTFAAIAMTVLTCLALGLYCQSLMSFQGTGTRKACVLSGFVAVGLALALVEAQLRHGSQRLRPSVAITFLRGTSRRGIERLDREARRLAKRMSLESPEVEMPAAVAWAYKRLQETVNSGIVHHLSRLQETSIRLAERGDAVAAAHALDAWTDVILAYLKCRKDCSLLGPSTINPMVPESDSQWILDRAFEQLNDVGARFLRLSQIPNARAVVRVYERLAEAASEVSFLNGNHENPILEQLGGYLHMYATIANAQRDIDVPFAAVDAFVTLGRKSLQGGLGHAPYGTCKHLDDLIAANATPDRTVILEAATMGYVHLIWEMLVTPTAPRNFQPAVASLENAHKTIRALIVLNPQLGPTGPLWALSRLPLDRMRGLIRSLRAAIRSANDADKGRYFGRFRDLADAMYPCVRRIAESTTSQSGYADLVPLLVFDVVQFLVHERNVEPYSRSIDEARTWLFLLTWINHNERPIQKPEPVMDAAAAATRILVYAIATDTPMEIALAAVEVQSGRTRVLNEHLASSYGYDEPRSIAPLTFAAAR